MKMTDWTKHMMSMTSLMLFALNNKAEVENKTDLESVYLNQIYNKLISDVQLVIDDLDKARWMYHESEQ